MLVSSVTRAAALPPVRVTPVPPTLTLLLASTLIDDAVTPETRVWPPTVTVAAPFAPIVAVPPTSLLSWSSNTSRLSTRSLTLLCSAFAIAICPLRVASWVAAEFACVTSDPSEAAVLDATSPIDAERECSVDATPCAFCNTTVRADALSG